MRDVDLAEAVSEHLRGKGFEVCEFDPLEQLVGGPLVIETKCGVSARFGRGVPACCGPQSVPLEWEATVRDLRSQRAVARARTDSLVVEVVAIAGSVKGSEAELVTLADELGTPLIVIDSDPNVASAGLKHGRGVG